MTQPRRDAFDLIVVGGGPAGMMAAGRAAEQGGRVLLLESGRSTGRKLLITAGGRCNVTNTAALPDFLRAFGRRGGFLRDAMTALSNVQFLDWLSARGVEVIREADGRLYPASQKAQTIRHVLMQYMESGGVEVACEQRVKSLLIENARIVGGVAAGKNLRAANVLIATGGLSYPATGSTGDGYALARQAGHAIAESYPAVTAFETVESWPRQIQGTPTRTVTVRALCKGRKLAEARGEAIWAHYGVAGPAVSDISTAAVQAMRKGGKVVLQIDLCPDDSIDAMDQWFVEAARDQGKRRIANVVSAKIPQRAAEVVVNLAGIDADKRMTACSKVERRKLVELMKRLELHISRPRPIEEAIVTGGGVALNEINPKTLESRLVKGLFFAGEVIDLAGPCGGFNLQAAFSTGYLIGQSVMQDD